MTTDLLGACSAAERRTRATLIDMRMVEGVVRLALQRLYRFCSPYRNAVVLGMYGGITVLAFAAAFFLRFELSWVSRYTPVLAATAPLLVVIRLACSRVFQLSTGRWRFVGTGDVVRLVGATTAGSAIFFLLTRALPFAPFAPVVPRSVILIEWVLTTYLTAGVWIAYRTGFEQMRYRSSANARNARRVLIVGAGEAGNMLVREMCRMPTGYRPVGFVDDDSNKWGTRIQGLEVLGGTADLRVVASTERVDEIIIAVPSASPERLRDIVAQCEATGLPFKVLPGISEVLAGQVHVGQLRELRIEDLLGREPIKLELPELAEDLRGRTVLITGAAGSIGSELSRQVALHEPGALILFDQAETELFYLELALRETYPALRIVPVVGDIVDAGGVERVFREHRPDRVFHAAAYKHVPMMEVNCREAVRNNVIGTWRIADASGRYGVERFVLVSTDKAVRPANMMGATKRLAEMVVLELQDQHLDTTYAAVRFGNVLGSNGSVIPIFKRQLKEGKPLTVTHPDVTRYFMTIPEAVQLILQSTLLPGIRGRIAMLEMGEPVRIVDLAKNLLSLSGAASTNGRSIVYTGLRPGEKLHEELVAPDEGTVSTPISKVRMVIPSDGMIPKVIDYLDEWGQSLDSGAGDAVVRVVAGMFSGLTVSLPDEGTENKADVRRIAGGGSASPRARRMSETKL